MCGTGERRKNERLQRHDRRRVVLSATRSTTSRGNGKKNSKCTKTAACAQAAAMRACAERSRPLPWCLPKCEVQ